MADETSGVVEQIQLKLKTNFADELKKVARTYTSFVGDVSKINNSLLVYFFSKMN